jgi:hypothetical protein
LRALLNIAFVEPVPAGIRRRFPANDDCYKPRVGDAVNACAPARLRRTREKRKDVAAPLASRTTERHFNQLRLRHPKDDERHAALRQHRPKSRRS